MTTKKLVPALLHAACLLEYLLTCALSRINEEIISEDDEKEKEKLESVYDTVDEFVNLLSSKLDNLSANLSLLGYDLVEDEEKQFNDFNKV